MSRGFWIVLIVAIAVLLFIRATRSPDPSVERQRINMAIAQEELSRVRAILDVDKRFKDVTTYIYTGQDGAIGIVGRVETEEHLFALMKAVAAEQLRVAVAWQVKVLAGD